MTKKYNVGVLGATGAVGQQILTCLGERIFPIDSLKVLASERSVGKTVDFYGDLLKVEKVGPDSFNGLDLAIFSAGSEASSEYAPIAAKAGCIVIDNSSKWRMDSRVPLIIPEINPGAMKKHKGIIANPNCSTIQMLVALKPIYDAVGIKRIVVSTYQSVSGSGYKGVKELANQSTSLLTGQEAKISVYPHRIAFNCLPHIDSFLDNGYTKEEMKMVNETIKIFDDKNIKVTATCVRIPLFYGHSEAVWIETGRHISPEAARELLNRAPGIVVIDDPEINRYPMASDCINLDEVMVGRIRADLSCENGLAMWVVADNIRKGAATNAVQIAELLIKDSKLMKTDWSD
ncbi:MAG: aspartate-semialdehyde dehydrogenase [Deltaproteobacteria bacterium]|jgi:aspartate-semialdehyde dehydrogenase|nr:aspartate-semialdehyde dehydrogenase [Deltaproteobacteria bacterium]